MQLALPSEGLACTFPAALAQLTALTTLDLTFNRLTGRCAQPGGRPVCRRHEGRLRPVTGVQAGAALGGWRQAGDLGVRTDLGSVCVSPCRNAVPPRSAAVAASGPWVPARGGSLRPLHGPLGRHAARRSESARRATQAAHAVHWSTITLCVTLEAEQACKRVQAREALVCSEAVTPSLAHHGPTMGPPPCLLSPLQRPAASRARAVRSMDADVAHVRRALPRLQSLQLAYNRLEGSLPCALAGAPLASLGAASNRLSGSLPACLLAAPMAQLSLTGNGLAGWLPAPPPGCVLQALSLHGQVTPVLVGPPRIPLD